MPAFLKFKDGVIVSRQAIIAAAVINAANQIGLEGAIVVTSGRDGVHSPRSKHYTDEALDVRTKTLSTTQKHDLLRTVQTRLGSAYDILLEDEGNNNEHLHLEYDP